MTEDVLCCQPYTYSILASEDDHNPKISIKINPLFDFQSKITNQEAIIQKLQQDRTQNIRVLDERTLMIKKMFEKMKYDEGVINELKARVLEFEEKEKLGFSKEETLKKEANEQKEINEILTLEIEKLKNENSEQRLNLEELRKILEHEEKANEMKLLEAEVVDLRVKVGELNEIIENEKVSKFCLESEILSLRKETESLMLSPTKSQGQTISKRKEFELKRLKSENEKLDEDLNLLENDQSAIIFTEADTQTENENEFAKTDSAIEEEEKESDHKRDNHEEDILTDRNNSGKEDYKLRQEERIEETNELLESHILNQADEKNVEKESQKGNVLESVHNQGHIEIENGKFESLQKQFEEQNKSLLDLQQQNELLRLNLEELKEAELLTTEKLEIQSKKVSELLKENSKLEKKNSKLDSSKNSKGSKTSEKSDSEILKFKKEIEEKNEKIQNLEEEKDRLKVLTSDLLKETEEIMKNIHENKSIEKNSQQSLQMIEASKNEIEGNHNQNEAEKNDSNQIKEFFDELCQHFEVDSGNENMKIELLLTKLRKNVGINVKTGNKNETKMLNEENDENLLASEEEEGGFHKESLKITNLNDLPLIFCDGSKQEEPKQQQLEFEPIFIVEENMKMDAERENEHSLNTEPIAFNFMNNLPLMLAPLNLEHEPFTVVPLLSTTVPYSNENFDLEKEFFINNFRNIDKGEIQKLLNLSLERQGELLNELEKSKSMSQENVKWLVENVGSSILQEFFKSKCDKLEENSS